MVTQLNKMARRVPTWLVYTLGFLPAVWLFYQALAGQLGVDPAKVLEHEYGRLALQFLIGGLAITPMRRQIGINLLKFRRALGLVAFGYVFLHLLVWLILDVQLLDQIVADILKRPYITVGMAAFALMLPLAATSNNWSVRRLGAGWRKLHKLTYAVVLLGALHFVLLAKGFQLEPLIYAAVVISLLLMRLPKIRSLGLA